MEVIPSLNCRSILTIQTTEGTAVRNLLPWTFLACEGNPPGVYRSTLPIQAIARIAPRKLLPPNCDAADEKITALEGVAVAGDEDAGPATKLDTLAVPEICPAEEATLVLCVVIPAGVVNVGALLETTEEKATEGGTKVDCADLPGVIVVALIIGAVATGQRVV